MVAVWSESRPVVAYFYVEVNVVSAACANQGVCIPAGLQFCYIYVINVIMSEICVFNRVLSVYEKGPGGNRYAFMHLPTKITSEWGLERGRDSVGVDTSAVNSDYCRYFVVYPPTENNVGLMPSYHHLQRSGRVDLQKACSGLVSDLATKLPVVVTQLDKRAIVVPTIELAQVIGDRLASAPNDTMSPFLGGLAICALTENPPALPGVDLGPMAHRVLQSVMLETFPVLSSY